MKYFFALMALIYSLTSIAESLVPKLNGSCDEIINTFDFIEREKDQSAGIVYFEGFEGLAAVFCDDKNFRRAMIIFEVESVDTAISLYKALERNLKLVHEEIDTVKTHEFAESLYLFEVMSGEPGFLGGMVYAIWPSDKNGLNLKIHKAGRAWTVAVFFGT
ncbi:hypothetical protein [Alkalimonas sp.]|uniref:hypothetical protein n=1 Tax=Alkalimonas sp. TaxID=1872453 RepID=UPI00263BE51B|nr:hypothetical protein [Alkalimonas sp.]MCC5825303.1 hypothetical protein [Alkalimonas sp.]